MNVFDNEVLLRRVLLVIDTNLPVTWHFADNMCAYCIGYSAQESEKLWAGRFYQEMNVSPEDNPYSRYVMSAQTKSGLLRPCSVYPTFGYKYNGRHDYFDMQTGKTLNGRVVSFDEIENEFNLPACMSVAIFFSRRLDDLRFRIVEARAKKFCASYPNAREGKYHEVTDVHYLLGDGYHDARSFTQQKMSETSFYRGVMEKSRSIFKEKTKVQIEELPSDLAEGTKKITLQSMTDSEYEGLMDNLLLSTSKGDIDWGKTSFHEYCFEFEEFKFYISKMMNGSVSKFVFIAFHDGKRIDEQVCTTNDARIPRLFNLVASKNCCGDI